MTSLRRHKGEGDIKSCKNVTSLRFECIINESKCNLPKVSSEPLHAFLGRDNDVANASRSTADAAKRLSGETSSILRFGIEMACREGIPDLSSARLAVINNKDTSCDGASQLRNCCHQCLDCEPGVNSCDGASHLLWRPEDLPWPSLCDETGEESCDVASRVCWIYVVAH